MSKSAPLLLTLCSSLCATFSFCVALPSANVARILHVIVFSPLVHADRARTASFTFRNTFVRHCCLLVCKTHQCLARTAVANRSLSVDVCRCTIHDHTLQCLTVLAGTFSALCPTVPSLQVQFCRRLCNCTVVSHSESSHSEIVIFITEWAQV